MVKVGFICEGETESLILRSTSFTNFFKKNNIECVGVQESTGNVNLLPLNIQEYCDDLIKMGADVIYILTDLDTDKCITQTKNRVGNCKNSVSIICVKEIESWFLSDSKMLSRLMQKNYFYEFPELESDPYLTLRNEFKNETGRGLSRNSKLIASNWFINNGFTVEEAANHPSCSSAKYFIEKLKSISN